mmetsp:Transcript_819/g.1882  ORF Transcript_819/g.1882 Transcript_819/m.1882 type:complete len:80 (-) Transcript_819:834-1073(-)
MTMTEIQVEIISRCKESREHGSCSQSRSTDASRRCHRRRRGHLRIEIRVVHEPHLGMKKNRENTKNEKIVRHQVLKHQK